MEYDHLVLVYYQDYVAAILAEPLCAIPFGFFIISSK